MINIAYTWRQFKNISQYLYLEVKYNMTKTNETISRNEGYTVLDESDRTIIMWQQFEKGKIGSTISLTKWLSMAITVEEFGRIVKLCCSIMFSLSQVIFRRMFSFLLTIVYISNNVLHNCQIYSIIITHHYHWCCATMLQVNAMQQIWTKENENITYI